VICTFLPTQQLTNLHSPLQESAPTCDLASQHNYVCCCRRSLASCWHPSVHTHRYKTTIHCSLQNSGLLVTICHRKGSVTLSYTVHEMKHLLPLGMRCTLEQHVQPALSHFHNWNYLSRDTLPFL
jgi:hypothetical protein